MSTELATSSASHAAVSTTAPPLAPRPPFRSLEGTEATLERWREDAGDGEDDWAVPVSRKEVKGKARAVPGDETARGDEVREEMAALRARRAVASESWDDDFDFHAPPIASPRRASSRAPSSSRSRPTTPLHRQTSSASHVPSTPSSRRGSPPASPRRGLSVGGPATLSLDSLASSIAWASDQEPTVTVLSSTAAVAAAAVPPASREPHQSHRASASTATTRPPLSRQTTPRTRIPKLSASLSIGTAQPSWTDSAPCTDSDYRTDTPCLTEGSFNSLTTAEDEIVTEHEGDGAHEAAAAPSSRPPGGESTFGARLKSMSGSKKWSFGRRGSVVKGVSAQPQQQMPPPPPPSSRRVGTPEVMVVDRLELSRARLSNSPRSNLPRPVSRSAGGGKGSGSTGGSASSVLQARQQQARAPHSSTTSNSTSSISDGRARRTSLQFAPPPLVPPSFFRRGSLVSTRSPTESIAFSWREYSGTTTEGDEDEEDDGETTGADLSDLSGDEAARRPRRRAARGVKGPARLADAITPSTSFATTSTRPVSPVDSILGGNGARWNASQVSFASSASAFALRSAPSSMFVAGPGADATHGQGQKRKLTKRRPSSGLSPSSTTHDHLLAGSLGTASDRPLLAPSIFSNSSGGSSQPSSSRTVLHRARSCQRPPPPALPFADDSDVERAPRQRSVTSPVQLQQQHSGERGQVVDVDDPEWLGVVPFPPSPRASLEARTLPPASTAPTLSAPPSRSSRALRKVSGAAPKSHPPVTGRTQGEAKARRGSGLGQALSSLLSRSTSSLPLGGGGNGGGKRAASPAPSGKSVKSSKSGLFRRPSSRASRVTVDETSTPPLPKSPSLSALRKRSSVFGPAPPLPTSASAPVLPAPSSPRPLLSTTSSSLVAVPRSSSTFSFLRRPRAFSRTTTKETPVSPVSPQQRSSRQFSLDDTPRPTTRTARAPRPSAPPNDVPHRRAQASAAPHGQLNPEFKMPRPVSNVSAISSSASGITDATDSTIMALGSYRDASATRLGRGRAHGEIPPVPPLPRHVRARPGAAPMGHRPSLSLSSIMPMRSASPRLSLGRAQPLTPGQRLALDEPTRPLTALGGPIERGGDGDDELDSGDELALPRRNSLGDLRIPARITNAQKKIEEDLERVKQFAKAVEELKALRRQYDQLIYIFAEPASSPTHLPLERPSADALHKTAQAARRVEIDYSAWWEQAQTLIDLGDGKPTKDKASPGTLASRRDRCVSLAPEVTPPRARSALALPSESETETEASTPAGVLGRNDSVARRLRRRPSASSIETDASVAVRQREMLRGVLAPTMKGASLPSRAPPAPRPPLPRLDPALTTAKRTSGVPLGISHTLSPSTPSSPVAKPLPPVAARRVSRGGVFGIREFLLRLRSKATEELAASVGSIPVDSPAHPLASSTPSLGRRSVSDPSSRPRTPLRAAGASSLRTSAPPLAPKSPSSPRRPSSSESDEDWDADLAESVGSPPSRSSMLELDGGLDGAFSAVVSARRERTRSVIVTSAGVGAGAGAGAGRGKGGELMVLTTEAMPHLLAKVREVREACEACIGLLKGLTV